MDDLLLLERSLDQLRDIVAAIQPDQLQRPTPCPEWDVEHLLRHVIGQDMRNFTLVARGGQPDWQAPADDLVADAPSELQRHGTELMEAWRATTPEQTVAGPGGQQMPLRARIGQQIAEFAVHGWDLVRAAGLSLQLDDAVAERSLEWAKPMLRPEMRGSDKAFGVEVPVADGAPVYERLAGWFGRDPSWTPASA